MVAQFTDKTINSERPIYFLSLMSCSINKLKSHMLFTCKNFKFSDLTWEKDFCTRKWWGDWRPSCPPFSLRPCIRSTLIARSFFTRSFFRLSSILDNDVFGCACYVFYISIFTSTQWKNGGILPFFQYNLYCSN